MLCFSELSVSGGICGGDQLVSISERLIAIMKNYVSAERYFPVGKLEGRKRSTAELHVQQFVCSEQDVCHTLLWHYRMFVIHYSGITGCLSYIIVALQDVCPIFYSGITGCLSYIVVTLQDVCPTLLWHYRMFVLHYSGFTGCLSFIIVTLQDVCPTLLWHYRMFVIHYGDITGCLS